MADAIPHEDRASLTARFWLYQRERFPLGAYALLITVFTFSAAAYSRMIRGAPGFIDLRLFLIGAATCLVFFFWLRILDEHKDADIDRRFRPELPVPRGLIELRELRSIGLAALALVLTLNAVFAPVMLWAAAVVAFWAALMTKEFFIRDWLRSRIGAYLVTHMAIMPIIDAYTTGLDWLAGGVGPHEGLTLFLVVTFLNGTLMEIGRKMRSPEAEREGVDTYTKAWGVRRAPRI